jgi:ankyrin repeat protein
MSSSDTGRTELHIAASLSNNSINVKQLVENGRDMNAKNNENKTTLHYASSISNNLDVIKYVVDNGAQ